LSKGWFKLQESKNHVVLVEKEKVNAELLFLRSQINPHFLFNSLNNIYSLTLKKDAKAPEIVLKLASVLRYMIYESNERFVPLRKEVAYIHSYIELQLLRIRDASSIHFTTAGEMGDQPVAPLVFIIFIENSFKHGVKTSIETPYIHIELTIAERRLQFMVKNNKGKAAEAVTEEYSGIGLENVRRRLALLYPQKHQLTVDENEDWYTIILQLDLDVESIPVKTGD
jgi:LytS/YehU family sensor histidine kinase